MNVLLIEPDVILAGIYKDAFERVGMRVSHAANAQAAILAADARRPDVVVLEMQLAAHSGAAFLYEFRSYTDWMEIPVVVHTLIPPDKLQACASSFAELRVASSLYKPATSLRKLVSTVRESVTITV